MGRVKKPSEPTKSEREIQIECVKFFRERFPKQIILSISNEAAWKNWARYEPMGCLHGAADLLVTLKDRVFFVEMKTKTGVQSDNQLDFQSKCEAIGISYYLCRSLDEFKMAILSEWNNIQQQSGLQQVNTQNT